MPSSISGLALPAIIAAVIVARIYLRQRSKIRSLGTVPPGRKVVVLNLLDRNR